MSYRLWYQLPQLIWLNQTKMCNHSNKSSVQEWKWMPKLIKNCIRNTLKVMFLTIMLFASETKVAVSSKDESTMIFWYSSIWTKLNPLSNQVVCNFSILIFFDWTIVVLSLPSPSKRINSLLLGILTTSLHK